MGSMSEYVPELIKIKDGYRGFEMMLKQYENAGRAEKERLDQQYGPCAKIEIPQFDKELKNFPAGVNEALQEVYREALYAGYLVARTQPWMKASWMSRNEVPFTGEAYYGNPGTEYQAKEVMRRFNGYPISDVLEKAVPNGGLTTPVLDWRENAKDEAFEQLSSGYGQTTISHFSNFPGRKDILTWGTTHVAVGFNDLICLIKSRLHEQSPYDPKTFHFVGVDVSPYACAKTSVVWEMMVDKSIPIASVIEVWFSAAWTKETLKHFRCCLGRVLKKMKSRLVVGAREVDGIPCVLEEDGLNGGHIPEYCRARIEGLESEKGKTLNGLECIVVDSGESQPGETWLGVQITPATTTDRLEVLIEGSLIRKSIKRSNLIPLATNIFVNASVRISGLQKAAHLNGKQGIATRWDDRSKRWEVEIEGQSPDEKKLRIQEHNLTHIGLGESSLCTENITGVLTFLEHWYQVSADATEDNLLPVSLEQVRHRWYKTQISDIPEKHMFPVGILAREQDRQAAMQYLTSGDVFLSAKAAADSNDAPSTCKPEIGSVCMWNNPAGTPKFEQAVAFGCIATEDYVCSLLGNSFDGHIRDFSPAAAKKAKNAGFNLMELFTWFIKDRINQTVRYPNAKFTAEFICQRVTLDNKILLTTIANHRPYTMSWSNVCDYMRPSTFHDIARSCSIHGDTVHYGYSMNWVCETFGTNIMDYEVNGQGKKGRKYWVERAVQRSLKGVCEHDSERYLPIWKLATTILYTKPYRCDPENLITQCLINETKYWMHWSANFFEKGKIPMRASAGGYNVAPSPAQMKFLTNDNYGLTVMSEVIGLSNPFGRTNSPFNFAWTYDPEIKGYNA